MISSISKTVFLLFFLFGVFASFGQGQEQKSDIDSLYDIWQDASQLDSTRVDAYVTYIKSGYIDVKPDSAYLLAEALEKFCVDRNYPFGEAEALNLQGRIWQDRKDVDQAIDYYQRALTIREAIGDKNGVSGTVFNLGIVYQGLQDFPKALAYYERSLKLDEELGNKAVLPGTLTALSGIYEIQGEDLKAIEYLKRAISIDQELGNKTAAAIGLFNLGTDYKRLGDLTNSLDYCKRSLKAFEEIDHLNGVARILGHIGVVYMDLGDFPNAIKYFERSLTVTREIGDQPRISTLLSTMGTVFYEQGDYPKSLEYYKSSLKIFEAIADTIGIANSTNNIGNVYQAQDDYANALKYYERAIRLKEKIGSEDISGALDNSGIIYTDQEEYTKAMEYCKRSLQLREKQGDKEGISTSLNNIGNIYNRQDDQLKALEYYMRSFKLREALGNKVGITNSLSNIGKVYLLQGDFAKSIDYCSRSLTVAEDLGALVFQKEACTCLYNTYKAMKKGNEALLYLEKLSILDDSLKAEETALKLQQMEFAKVMRADSINDEGEKQNVQLAHDLEVTKKNKQRNIFIASGLFALLLAVGFFFRWRYVKKSRDKISKEKDRSENILLNILPAEIAEELKLKGSAEARDFDQVSILFTDFKEFTQLSEQLTAKELVGEINYCFNVFDGICEKYGIEKIKTIGDSYMAAGGLPAPSHDSTMNMVSAALEMAAFVVERKKERISAGQLGFEMRAGIHTGNVVAGIVGVKKFQYDIWGDTVNTASRIESHGEAGKVNISQSTYDLIKDDPQLSFIHRGKIDAKGKGEIEMYFVSKVD